MKKNIWICFIALMLVSFQTLSALSFGQDGAPYVENNIKWQPVKYENDDAGFKAAHPGSPHTGLSGGDVYTYSQYKGADYEIHTSLTKRYQPPKNEIAFMQQVENAFADEADIIAVPSSQKTVKYIAELYFKKTNKVVRIYCSSNSLYFDIVEGKDLTLFPLFFDTIQITK